MSLQKKLGQHFLVSKTIAKAIVSEANITKNDTVLEIGTGQGILVPFLCEIAGKVISIEADKKLYDSAVSRFSHIKNLVLKHGNGFKEDCDFTVFVSNLPYSKSKEAMEWLIQRSFLRAIVMVQKEFADKLQSSGRQQRAISVLVNHAANIQKILDVGKNNFKPQPKVNSVVLKLTSKKKTSRELIRTVNKLFSFRRKKIQNIAKQFGLTIISDKRLDELPGDKIIEIANQINSK
ncbi:MAG: ribosomal RNA small subunit methyltransferase A [Nitrosopumilaceae archaeon]